MLRAYHCGGIQEAGVSTSIIIEAFTITLGRWHPHTSETSVYARNGGRRQRLEERELLAVVALVEDVLLQV